MKYIEILIDVGDVYFCQNIFESILLVFQCYVEVFYFFGLCLVRVLKFGIRMFKFYIGFKRFFDIFFNVSIDMELEFFFCVVVGVGS